MYKIYPIFIKPIIDKIASIILICIFSPIFIIVSLLILIKMGKPIFFTQNRPGKNEKIFTIYKFRTMNNDKDNQGNLLSDDDRLPPFGKIIRKLSLDELPQLFNVLKGDMSFIGPRPLLCEYLSYYNKEQSQRHLVLPGMTGLAQVNGRNAISWEEKFKFDSEYAKNISLMMDVKIAFKTIQKVIQRDGISSSSGYIMEKFTGSKV